MAIWANWHYHKKIKITKSVNHENEVKVRRHMSDWHIPTKCGPSIKCDLFSPCYSWKITHLALNNIH